MPNIRTRDGVFRRKDTKGWYVSYIDAFGVRKRKHVEAYTRTQALNVLAQIKTKVEQERILGVKPESDITTEDLFRQFKKHQRARLRPSTFERLDGILKTLKSKLPLQAKQITRQTISEYISKRSESVSPGTIAKEVTTLKHILRLAVNWELLRQNTAAGTKLPTLPEGRTRYLSPTEFKAALEAAPEWMRGPMALAVFTGMRKGEILDLCWKDVDLANQRVYLTETKNGTMRVVPLNRLATAVLKGLPQGKSGEKVFRAVDGSKLSVYCRRVFKSVGIEDASVPFSSSHGCELARHEGRGSLCRGSKYLDTKLHV